MREAVQVSPEHPVLIDDFLEDAIEVDVDAIADGTDVVIGGIMEHIERAGVHSGDSACSLPPKSIAKDVQDEIRRQTVALARELGVVGLMNMQFAVKEPVVYILEVNPRASRTVPFVSKAIGVPLAKIAARVMVGKTLRELGVTRRSSPPRERQGSGLPVPQVSRRRHAARAGDEVDRRGDGHRRLVRHVVRQGGDRRRHDAAAQRQGLHLGARRRQAGRGRDRASALPVWVRPDRDLRDGRVLERAGLAVERINKVREGSPHIVDALNRGEIAMVINTPEGAAASLDSFSIRRTALERQVPYFTTIAGAAAAAEGIEMLQRGELSVRALQDYHAARPRSRLGMARSLRERGSLDTGAVRG